MVVALPSACATEYSKELSARRGSFRISLEEALSTSSHENQCKVELSHSDIIVVSIDSLHLYVQAISERLSGSNLHSVLIVDEGQGIKNVLSRRSRAVQQIAPLFDRLIISTATPMPHGPKDIRGYLSTVGLPQPVDSYRSGVPERDLEVLTGVSFVTEEEELPFAPVHKRIVDYSSGEELLRLTKKEVRHELAADRKVLIFCSTNRAMQELYDLFPDVGRTVPLT